ncbi:MAG: two-component sensor histidine kinase, partial [Planctomycetia bacterium]|nr:two-component sensor histidine kinase [Planctomycetia bacterium]
ADTARTREGLRRSGGLGLAICKAIVKRHGGRITAANAAGRGAIFTVMIPRRAAAG